MSREKKRALIFLAIAGLFIVVLAMGLNGLELGGGMNYNRPAPTDEAPDIGGGFLAGGPWLLYVIWALLILGLILLPLYLIESFKTKAGRRRLLVNILLIVALLFFFDFLYNNLNLEATATPTPTPEAGPPVEALPTTVIESTPAPPIPLEPPSWLSWSVALTVAVLVVALVVLAVVVIIRRRAQQSAYEQLVAQAQAAIDNLRAGADLRQTILRCYRAMSQVLDERRGIHREKAMTPHEFEEQLSRQGLPAEPVHQLTWLFEEVRYGDREPGAGAEKTAIDCLEQIIIACRAAEESANEPPG